MFLKVATTSFLKALATLIKPAPCCLGDAKYWLFSFQEVASIIGRAVFCRAIFVRLVRSILSSPLRFFNTGLSSISFNFGLIKTVEAATIGVAILVPDI